MFEEIQKNIQEFNLLLSTVHILNSKVDKIMVSIADIQTALAADEVAEQKIIALLNTQASAIASLSAQLAAAIANNDPVAMQAVVDAMNADATAMTEAATSINPPGTPVPQPSPPGQPTTP